MPHVWAECESERQGRQWLFGGCFDFFPPPPITTCEVGGNDRQTESGEKRNAVCCNTWSCRRKRVVGGIACVWNASEAFWLSSQLHSPPLQIPPLSGQPAVPSLSRPVGSQRLFSGRGAAYSQGCRVNQWNALLHCRSVGWLLLHHHPALRTHKPQARRLSRDPESVEMKDNRPVCRILLQHAWQPFCERLIKQSRRVPTSLGVQ